MATKSTRSKTSRAYRIGNTGTTYFVNALLVTLVAIAAAGVLKLMRPPSVKVPGVYTTIKSVLDLSRHCSQDSAVVALQQYLQARSAHVHTVRLGTTAGLRGLQAAESISNGSTILAVPLDVSLSIATFSAKTAAGRVTASWQQHEDGDLLLDALALLYETLVLRELSPWALYLCTLPLHYGLPVNFSDSWSESVMQLLPDLSRLVDKRKAMLQTFSAMFWKALNNLPGGAAALQYVDESVWPELVMWAYAATKTRTLSVDTLELQGYLQLPDGLHWLSELGIMVPLLDLANHANTENEVSAVYAVQVKAKGNQKQIMLSLVATQDLQPGDEIRFSYIPNDAELPSCNYRWLLEYGFVVGDGRPERACYVWNITVPQVAAVISRYTEDNQVPSMIHKKVRTSLKQRLISNRMQLWHIAQVDASGSVRPDVLFWLQAATGDEQSAAMALYELLKDQLQTVQLGLTNLPQPAATISTYQMDTLKAVVQGGLKALEQTIDGMTKHNS